MRMERDPALSWEHHVHSEIRIRAVDLVLRVDVLSIVRRHACRFPVALYSRPETERLKTRGRVRRWMHGSGAKKEKSRRTLSRPLFSLIVLSSPSIPLVLPELCRFAQRSRFLPIASLSVRVPSFLICFRGWKSCEAKMYEAEISLGQSRTREREFSRESNRATEPSRSLYYF